MKHSLHLKSHTWLQHEPFRLSASIWYLKYTLTGNTAYISYYAGKCIQMCFLEILHTTMAPNTHLPQLNTYLKNKHIRDSTTVKVLSFLTF